MLKIVSITICVAVIVCLVDGRSFSSTKTCPDGYELIFNSNSGKKECVCLPYHLYWPLDGKCYREATQGPCQLGFKLVWNSESEKAECQCPAFWSRHAADESCYEEYTQGPCAKGQLFVQSQCVCNEEMTMHYHPETQQCFQLYTDGPCSPGQIFQFNYQLRRPECICKENHIRWTDGNCYEVNTVGPCNSTQCPQVTEITINFNG